MAEDLVEYAARLPKAELAFTHRRLTRAGIDVFAREAK